MRLMPDKRNPRQFPYLLLLGKEKAKRANKPGSQPLLVDNPAGLPFWTSRFQTLEIEISAVYKPLSL